MVLNILVELADSLSMLYLHFVSIKRMIYFLHPRQVLLFPGIQNNTLNPHTPVPLASISSHCQSVQVTTAASQPP